jgi:hypothetical protein
MQTKGITLSRCTEEGCVVYCAAIAIVCGPVRYWDQKILQEINRLLYCIYVCMVYICDDNIKSPRKQNARLNQMSRSSDEVCVESI